jgi:hypothetical protein
VRRVQRDEVIIDASRRVGDGPVIHRDPEVLVEPTTVRWPTSALPPGIMAARSAFPAPPR